MRVLYVAIDLRDADILQQEVRRATPDLAIDICAGLAALRARQDHASYDIILMDGGLPEAEQLQLIHYVRVRQLALPIIVLASATGPGPGAALSAGADDFISRGPKTAERLAPALRQSVERYRTLANTLRENDKLKRSEARLRLIIEALPTGVLLLDQAGKVLAMNAAGVQYFGSISPQDIVGRHFSTLIPVEDQPGLRDFLDKVMNGDEASLQFSSVVHDDETPQVFNLRGLCIQRDQSGQTAVLGVLERVPVAPSAQHTWSTDFDLGVAGLPSPLLDPDAAPMPDLSGLQASPDLTDLSSLTDLQGLTPASSPLAELQARCEEADARAATAEAELASLQATLNETEEQQRIAAERLKQIEVDASAAVAERDSLRQALAQATDAAAALTATIDGKQAELTALGEQLAAARQAADELRAAVDGKDASIAAKDTEIAERDARLAEQQARLAERDETIGQQTARLTQLDALLADKDTLTSERAALVQEKQDLVAAHAAALQEKDALIAAHEASIQGKDAALAGRDAALLEKESLITAYQASIADEDALVKTHEATLHEKEALSAAHDALLREKNALAAAHDAALREKEALAAAQAESLRERDALLATHEASVRERNALIIAHDASLREKDALLATRDAALIEKNALVAARDAVLIEKEALVAARDAALAEKDGHVSARDAALRERDALIADKDVELAARETRLAEASARASALDDVRAALERSRQELEESRAELLSMSRTLTAQREAQEGLQATLTRKQAETLEVERRAQTRITELEREHRAVSARLQELLEQASKDSADTARGLGAEPARRGSERVGRLAAAMAGDLHAAVGTAADAVKALATVASAQGSNREAVDRALDTILRCGELARHLLRLSARYMSQSARVDLGHLVRQQDALLHHLAGPDIELHFDLASGLVSSDFDSQDITHVLTSLMVAARDALPLGGAIRVSTASQRIDGAPHDHAHDQGQGQGRRDARIERPRPLMLSVTAKGYGIRPVPSTTCEEVTERCGGLLTTVIEPNVSWTLTAMLPGSASDADEFGAEDLTRSA
jgi:PAS domain S-box-containing protein